MLKSHMPTETYIAPKKILEKLLIYWRTKNYARQTYDIALIIAVAIYTNKNIYEEEMEAAKQMLYEHLNHDDSVEKIMDYIELKLLHYLQDDELWYEDLRTCRALIKKDEELYLYFLNIFEADEKIDDEEIAFESSLKKMLLRS
ncbi:MAG: hypothetical protein U9Q62_11505 [Campylobacterota bacterium]|nr:hypothetical protein [Campylobacterota bacterium]